MKFSVSFNWIWAFKNIFSTHQCNPSKPISATKEFLLDNFGQEIVSFTKFNEFQTNLYLVLTEISKEKSYVGKNVKTKRSYNSYPFRRRCYKTVNQIFLKWVYN